MAFQFTCPNGHLLSAEESQAGQPCQCPQCRAPFLIPTPTAPSYPSYLQPGTNPFAAPQESLFPGEPAPFSPIPNAPPAPVQPAAPGPIQFASPRSLGTPQFAPAPQQFAPAPNQPVAPQPMTAPLPQQAAPNSTLGDDLLSELPAMQTGGDLSMPGGVLPGTPGYDILSQPLPDPLHIPCPNGHPLETPHDMLGQHVMCPFCQAQFMLHLESSLEFRRRREAEQDIADARSGQIWMRWAIGFAVVILGGLVALIIANSRAK